MPEFRRSTRVASQANDQPKKKAKSETTKSEKSDATSSSIEIGDSLPDLVLKDENDEDVSLPEIASLKKYLVIFAYPRASTPGCTRQACGFQSNFEWLSNNNTTVYGLSSDQPKAQLNFVNKQGLKYHLLSDPSKKLIGPLGAKKSPSGIKRSHWIFKDGKLVVKKIQISPEVSINSAKADIEKFIEEDSKSDAKQEENEPEKEDNEAETEKEHQNGDNEPKTEENDAKTEVNESKTEENEVKDNVPVAEPTKAEA